MALTKIESGNRYISPSKMTVGQKVTGHYVSQTIDPKYNTKQHNMQTENGSVCVNGSGKLDHLLGAIRPGDYIEIVYLGKKVIETGQRKGTSAHDFDLFRDPDKTLKVSDAQEIQIGRAH